MIEMRGIHITITEREVNCECISCKIPSEGKILPQAGRLYSYLDYIFNYQHCVPHICTYLRLRLNALGGAECHPALSNIQGGAPTSNGQRNGINVSPCDCVVEKNARNGLRAYDPIANPAA